MLWDPRTDVRSAHVPCCRECRTCMIPGFPGSRTKGYRAPHRGWCWLTGQLVESRLSVPHSSGWSWGWGQTGSSMPRSQSQRSVMCPHCGSLHHWKARNKPNGDCLGATGMICQLLGLLLWWDTGEWESLGCETEMLYHFFWHRCKVWHNQDELTAVTVNQIFCPKTKHSGKCSCLETASTVPWQDSPTKSSKIMAYCDDQGRQRQPTGDLYSPLQWKQTVQSSVPAAWRSAAWGRG